MREYRNRVKRKKQQHTVFKTAYGGGGGEFSINWVQYSAFGQAISSL